VQGPTEVQLGPLVAIFIDNYNDQPPSGCWQLTADITGLNKRYRQVTISCTHLAGQTLWCCVFYVGSTTVEAASVGTIRARQRYGATAASVSCHMLLFYTRGRCLLPVRITADGLDPVALAPLPAWIQLWESHLV
jgi:hypothetical protein